MRNLRRMRKLWNDVLDNLEAAVLAWILRTALARHKPEMIEQPNVYGDDLDDYPEPWCLACVEHWPCARWGEVAGLARKLGVDKP